MRRRVRDLDPKKPVMSSGIFKPQNSDNENVNIVSPMNYQPEALLGPSVSVESVEFVKDYKMPICVDRDAVLFHQMQLARAKSKSTDSLDSTQSVPMGPSFRDLSTVSKSSSHSIEVLIHDSHEAPHRGEIGGSHPHPININQAENQVDRDYIEVRKSDSQSQLEDPILQKLERTLAVSFTDVEDDVDDPAVCIMEYFSCDDSDDSDRDSVDLEEGHCHVDLDQVHCQEAEQIECNIREHMESNLNDSIESPTKELECVEKSENEPKEVEKKVLKSEVVHSEDTSVVSAYKKSPTLREKRKAPSPPSHRPQLPLKQKERRAPPPPVPHSVVERSQPPPRPLRRLDVRLHRANPTSCNQQNVL